jgi:hypothetical protein
MRRLGLALLVGFGVTAVVPAASQARKPQAVVTIGTGPLHEIYYTKSRGS